MSTLEALCEAAEMSFQLPVQGEDPSMNNGNDHTNQEFRTDQVPNPNMNTYQAPMTGTTAAPGNAPLVHNNQMYGRDERDNFESYRSSPGHWSGRDGNQARDASSPILGNNNNNSSNNDRYMMNVASMNGNPNIMPMSSQHTLMPMSYKNMPYSAAQDHMSATVPVHPGLHDNPISHTIPVSVNAKRTLHAQYQATTNPNTGMITAVNTNNLNNPVKKAPTKTRKRGWVKKTWEQRLVELEAYKAQHGDCNVPTLSKENPSLGHWVHDQRKQYRLYESKKPTAMTSERVQKLETIGFKWALQKHTCMKSWSERCAELIAYKNRMGHTNVPIRWKENPSLGQWVSTQRQEYGNFLTGKKTNMNQERIDTLNGIGFVWCLRDTAKMAPRKSWDMHFKALQKFKEENGNCDVRVRSKQHPTGSLGRWVEKQRSQYSLYLDGKPCKLTKDQISKLDDVGFKWRVRNDHKRKASEMDDTGDANTNATESEDNATTTSSKATSVNTTIFQPEIKAEKSFGD